MIKMTAKEYLQQLRKMDMIINQKIQEKAELRMMSTSISGFDYSKDKVQTSSSRVAPYEKIICKMEALEEEINEEIDHFVDQKHFMIKQIQSLFNERHVMILYLRYVQFKNFENIAVEMNLSYQYTIELHGSALQEFEKTYENLLNPI